MAYHYSNQERQNTEDEAGQWSYKRHLKLYPPGLSGSRSMLETPPKMNRVIRLTGNPRARVTSE